MFIPEFADFQSPTLNDLCFIRERPDDQSLNLCFFPECPDDFYYGEYGIQLTGSCDCFNVTCPCKACWGGAACSRMQMSALCKRMTVQRFWRMHKCGRWFSVHLLSVGWKKYQWILSSVKSSITPPVVYGLAGGDALYSGNNFVLTCTVQGDNNPVISVVFSCPGHDDFPKDVFQKTQL